MSGLVKEEGINPDSITLKAPVPLTGVFGRVEKEIAAAAMVAACQDHGDWFAMLPMDVAGALNRRGDLPWTRLTFIAPDFHGLVADGLAAWSDDGTEPKRLAFTPEGIAKLAKSRWNVWSAAAQEHL